MSPAKKSRKLTELLRKRPITAGGAALGMAFLGSSDADAALQITEIGVTISDEVYHLNLDSDGATDFTIKDDYFDVKGRQGFEGSIFNQHSFAKIFTDSSGKAILFSEGDTVGATSGSNLNSFAELYDDLFETGPLLEEDSSGYIGLRIDNPTNGENYGWVEIARGSAIVRRAGYETDSGVGALIPLSTDNTVIPEPASMAVWGMLATGAAGMSTLRRRRRERTA